ncbi:hypothetical protein Vadar_010272 [Vaccinium darrowii]|uniref:Uncharacterized protein n=1 Tax=Vaccinium darrowii TaxID=229202 RepID=A0ACB7X987_9ERIC|nr:hypothetical protein Vadar_010272 [Vaccinium darrowii]
MSDEDVDISSRGDDLSLCFKTFTLTHAESKEVTILEEDIKLSEAECHRSLIGKVVTSKMVNLHGIKNTMAPLWGNSTGFKVLEIGENLFQFVFGLEKDLLRVLAGKPWFFNNSFLILMKWNPAMKVGTKIGKSMGEFMEIDMPVLGHREGRLMRIMAMNRKAVFNNPKIWKMFATSPAKSGNSKAYDHGANRGAEIVQIPNLVERVGNGDLNVMDIQEQIGDMAKNGILFEKSSQRDIPSYLSNAATGILKPKSLGHILSQDDNGPMDLNGPVHVSPTNATAHDPIIPSLVTSLQASKSSPANFPINQINPTSLPKEITPSQTTSLTITPSPVLPHLQTENIQIPNQSFSENANLSLQYFASPDLKFTSGVTSLVAHPQKKDATPYQKKRGRPVGSKSKTDRRRNSTVQDNGSTSSTGIIPPTVSAPRVGEKRSSCVIECKESDRDGDEVSSLAKRPRVEGNTAAKEDSIMDDSISLGTVEEASREWPHGVQ